MTLLPDEVYLRGPTSGGGGGTGPTGPPGPPGADGADGTIIHDGPGPPTALIGDPGDYYLDTSNDTLYGPRAAGSADSYEAIITATTAGAPGYTLGTKFRVTVDCQATGIAFTVDAANSVTTGWWISIYRNSDQVRLGHKAVTVVPGVNRLNFDAGVSLVADTLYLATIYNPGSTVFMYKDNWSVAVDSGPLHLYASLEHGISAARYIGSINFPDTDWGGSLVGTATPLILVATEVWPVAMAPGGGGGSGLRTFEQAFASASTTWVVNHNFNSVAVEVNAFDPTGLIQYEPEVELTSVNTATIRWYYPTTGLARVLG